MKKTLVLATILLVSACNNNPLPAFAEYKTKCKEVDCGELRYSGFPIVNYAPSNNINSYPDKHYDQILGHHDYSIESDH